MGPYGNSPAPFVEDVTGDMHNGDSSEDECPPSPEYTSHECVPLTTTDIRSISLASGVEEEEEKQEEEDEDKPN